MIFTCHIIVDCPIMCNTERTELNSYIEISMFSFITHMRAKPGKRSALIDANKAMQAITANEQGVPIYAFHTSEEDPNEFYYYDLYESQEAYDAHCATPEFHSMMGMISELADIVEMTKLIPFGTIKSEPIG
jgi:quinol monooxygenase YgiN